ncbi:MAG: IS200/IS605 family transposase [Acidimicrobiales bacterium]
MATTQVRLGAHSATSLHAHLVFVTKYRRKVLREQHLARLEELLCNTCDHLGASLIEFNGESDHVHLLVSYPPALAVSTLVMRLKGTSARTLRSICPDLRRAFGRHRGLWSDSYYAASVGGAPISVLRQYIEQHNRPA